MKTKAINIIFDGPPSHVAGRFVETEDDEGHGIKSGEWIERDNGYWSLRIDHLPEDNKELDLLHKIAKEAKNLWDAGKLRLEDTQLKNLLTDYTDLTERRKR